MKAKLYINKENLKYNIENIKKRIDNKDIIAMVKANAYGAGDKEVVSILDSIGIKNYGVANVNEALRVRSISKSSMILITSVTLENEIADAVENDISLSVSDIENIEEIDSIANSIGKKAKLHIKINTGMTRLGFTTEGILEEIDKILEFKNIEIEGIYTHLSCADIDEEFTKSQIDDFNNVVNVLKKKVDFKYIHFLNSDGTFKYAKYNESYTHVRVGIVMYGYGYNLKPILKLTAPIIHINNIDRYSRIGYGATAIAKPGEKIAVIKIGYADGLSRLLSNNLQLKLNGNNCKQIGNICMDMSMVDVTGIEVKVGNEVEIFGYDNDLKEIAKKSGKIVYEVISNLGDRIERVIE